MWQVVIFGEMISNRNILCMSSTEWDGNYIKPTVELMKILSSGNRLLFVNSPYTVADVFAGLRGKKTVDFKRALGMTKRLRTITAAEGGEVNILTPPIGLTINFLPKGFLYRAGLTFNAWQVRRSVKKALRQLNMNQDLIHIVAFNPGMGLMNGRRYEEKTLIYHCYDEVRGGNAWLKKHGVWLEEAFMKKIDGVIVSSKGLFESKVKQCANCFVVKNAVNLELFGQGFHKEVPEKQIIGYVGTVDDRLDYNILQHMFTSLPQTQFVFVGRIMSDRGLSILKKYANVKVEGPKTPQQLPAYLKTFSACIIPFVKDAFTKGIYPMKINEYLAAGLPVISTGFGDMLEFKELISIGDTPETFLEHCIEEIQTDNTDKKRSRFLTASQNTWKNRAEAFSDAIIQMENQPAR